MSYIECSGIKYKEPKVVLMQQNGLGVAEMAGRSAYDSFDKSENDNVKELNGLMCLDDVDDMVLNRTIKGVNDIESSKLLDDLSWTYFHHSVIEHSVLSYIVRDTSRGCLHEHARHRIQSLTVRSTRYTMGPVINAFLAVLGTTTPMDNFRDLLRNINFLVTIDSDYNEIEYDTVYNKLKLQYNRIGRDEFIKISTTKDMRTNGSFDIIDYNDRYVALCGSTQKRNVGDAFKHIVTDNWKVDMVVTFNLRSLRNYFELRDSGSAYFHIRELAKAMKLATPVKYLKLIDKEYRGK